MEEPKPAVEEPKPAEEEPEQIKATKATPLSPYAAWVCTNVYQILFFCLCDFSSKIPSYSYEDLKPPSSPTPIASTGAGATKPEIVPAPASSPPLSVEASSSETSIEDAIPQTVPKKAHAYSPYIK